MLRALFGEIQTGRLRRLPYLGRMIGLSVLIVLVAIGIGAAIGVAERLVGGEVAQAQALIAERFGTVGLVGIVVVFAVLVFAHANIAAKRVRDMGLPGWWVLLSAAVIGAAIAAFAGPAFSNLWTTATTLALLLIPSNLFDQGAKTASV